MKRRASPPDSLELLLDTLCNTFGGVLFIGMLVLVLLQLSGRSPSPSAGEPIDAATLDDLTQTLKSLRAEIDQLELADQTRLAAVDTELSDEIRETREALQQAEAAHEELARRRDLNLADLGDRESTILEIDQELSSRDEAISGARRRLEELRQAQNEDREARSREIGSSVVHDTNAQPLAVEMRFDRLYIMHEYGSDGSRLGPNTRDFILLGQDASGILMTANPAAGLPIDDRTEFRDELARLLAPFPARSWYLGLSVRSDSFASFATLRTALSSLGYEFSMLLVEPGEGVIDRGGEFRGVQ